MSTPTRSTLAWYCVQTKPAKENYALFHLERQGFECYLPFIRCKRLYRGKKQWTTIPMFQRYLFVRQDDDEHLPKVRSTRGVANLVSFNNVPATVPAEVISEIRNRCPDDVLVQDEEPWKDGDQVKIIDGPYQGLNAIFGRKTSAGERVIILLEMMEQLVKVEINREQIIKSDED